MKYSNKLFRHKHLLLTIAIILISNVYVIAQPANAIELTQKNNWCSGYIYSNSSGSTSPPTSSCEASDQVKTWFKFQTATDYIKISVNGFSYTPELSLWKSDLTAVSCGSSLSLERVGLTIGQWYYVSVSSTPNEAANFSLCVNDQIPVLSNSCGYSGSTNGGSSLGPTSSCEASDQVKTWFKFQAATDYIKISVNGFSYLPELSLWKSDLTAVSCGSSFSLERVGLTIGQWYYVSVSSAPNEVANFSLCANDQIPVLTDKNNSCGYSGSTITGSTAGPSSSCEEPGHVKTWFKFQAATDYIKISVNGFSYLPELSLWKSDLTAVSCGSSFSLERVGLTIGQWYYVSVSSAQGELANFSLCANDQIPVLTNKNNSCGYSGSTITGSTAGPSSSCEEPGQVKTWFKFQATTDYIKVSVNGFSYLPELSLWKSDLTPVSCGSGLSLERIGLTIGQWYYVSVSSAQGELANFSLCANDQIPVLTDKNNSCGYSGSTITGSTAGPTSSCEEPGQVKTWFKFQASTNYISFTVNGLSYPPDISLWRSDLTSVACSSGTTMDAFGLTINAWYYVSVSSMPNEQGNFGLCVNDQITVLTNTNNWCSSSGAYSNMNGSVGGPTSTCETDAGQVKKWFKFQASTDYINIRSTGSYTTDISIWKSDLTPVTCSSGYSVDALGLTVNAWYYVSVSTPENQRGSFDLCINDQITVLTNKNNWCSTSSSYSNYYGSSNAPTSTCETDAGQVKKWFKFQATTDYINIRSTGSYTTDISIWKSDLTPVTCISGLNVDALGLTINAWYYVSVSTPDNQRGSFDLCVNDQLNLLAETSNWCSTSGSYSNVNGAPNSLTSTCETSGQVKTWFKFQAVTTYMKLTVTSAGINNPDISLWRSNLTQVSCISGTILETSSLTIGQWYYASVSSLSSESGAFGLCVLDNPQCLLPQPTIFPMTSTMTCNGLATGSITLTDSETGITYTLSNGQQMPGTGDALIWPNLSEGTYSLSARRSTCQIVNMGSIAVGGFAAITARVASAGIPSICNGETIQLLAYSEEGYTYQWVKDGVDISGATQYNYPASVQGAYKVRVTSNGCVKLSDPFTLTVNTKPLATITPAGPTIFCDGGSVVLNASTGTGYTYQWKLKDSDTFFDIEAQTSSSYTVRKAGVYKLATQLGGCSAESSEQTITINPLPIASIVSSVAPAICPGQSVTLLALGEVDSYQWKKNGSNTGATLSSYTTQTAIAGDQPATYRASVTKGLCTLETNEIIVSVKTLSAAITPPIGGPPSLPAGDIQTYTVSGAADADLFIWNTPPGINITYQNAKRSSALIGFNQLGEKTISVTPQKNGCDGTAVEKVIQVTDAVSSTSSQIPAELKITPDNQAKLPVTGSTFALNTVAQNEVRQVMATCNPGEYYAGFQLYYDAGDKNTTSNWTAYLEITFLQGASTILWTRTLQVDMASQTFTSTIFHDTPITCAGDYRFKIKTKTTLNGGIQAPESNIYLKVLLHERMTDVFVPTATCTLNYLLNNGMAETNWTYTGKAIKGYDLEWVWIEDHEVFSGTAQQAFQFKEPVRITTSDISYRHQAHYPKGRMWFRVRAVGYNPQYPTHRINGQWSYGSGSPLTINHPHYANAQLDKNWQLQTVFAEEGKYKKIASYYDGTLRQRQVQTNLSKTNQTLVGETLYDFEGRKSADILPVPTTGESLGFKQTFNTLQSSNSTVLANTSSIRKKFHYDNSDLINSIISETTGAGKYYSQNNTIASQHKDYIPDADGYVYSQTEYLNDGTGRVSRQSGVGDMFRMESGDNGHNTRYFYTEAARIELTRLFGPNVGNASHYKKNVVIDPNGQASVSYVDQAGQVIATALAGTPPANVDALPSYQTLPLTDIDLISKNTKSNGISQTVHKFLNETPGNSYNFRYDLSALGTAIPDLACQSCSYDFTINITDPTGDLLDLSAVALNESQGGKSYQRKNLTTPAGNCSTATVLSSVVINNVILSKIGDYTITKTLTAREKTIDEIKTIVQQSAVVQAQMAVIANSYTPDAQDCAICTSGSDGDAAINEAIDEITSLDCEYIYSEIIRKVKEAHPSEPDYEPTEAEIKGHALYCKYELCLKDKNSTVFDRQLARVDRWSIATDANHLYQNIVNITTNTSNPTMDPFFTQEESIGYPYRGTMQSKVNSIKIKGTSFTSSLSEVTDPNNAAYKVNNNGEQDPSGYHMLYFDLQKKRAQIGEAAYQDEIDKQRWTLFRNFYADLKRNIKLGMTEYVLCTEAFNELKSIDNLPQTTTDIVVSSTLIKNWGKDFPGGINKAVNVPVSNAELEMTIARLRNTCGINKFSNADSLSIANHLTTYFNGNEKNFLRLILPSDVGSNASLNSIQTILTSYGGCNLSTVAVQDPITCSSTINTTLYTFGPNLVRNPTFSACTANAAIPANGCTGVPPPNQDWKPAYGTPFLMNDKGFQLEAFNCSQDALMGTFTSALVPGKKYRLKFKRKSSFVTTSVYTHVTLSQYPDFGNSAQFFAEGCPNYTVVTYPDNVNFIGDPTPSSVIWSNAESPLNAYEEVEKIFIATAASTKIFFYIRSFSPTINADIIIKDVEVNEAIDTPISFCNTYNPTNPTLALWSFDWQAEIAAEIARCTQRATDEKNILVAYAQDKYLDEQATIYNNTYRTNCLNSATEQLNYSYTPREYHYTLYYYDQAGNLVQTVPPNGVNPLNNTDANSATPPQPGHTYVTRYQYSSVNQLLLQNTPDAGKSEFFYDKKGQLRVSRNAQQTVDNKYSYTKYDKHGRITEVGELTAAVPPTSITPYIDDSRFPTTGVQELPTYPLSDVTRTYYDNVNETVITKLVQQNLRGRVSYVEVTDKNGPDKSLTWYSYDPHGNVKSLLQQIPGLDYKRTDYVYDLVSGKVNYVFFQAGKTDQFTHKYSYDADNRIENVYTSSDAYIWNRDASYIYYAHGPLARTELGQYRVQGQDYYYTLQGWIKGVNMPFDGDPGKDGISPPANLNDVVGKDVYAYTLGYYQNDYKASNPAVILSDTRDQQWARYNTLMGNTGLYNGNIGWMVTDLLKIGDLNSNRAKGMQAMLYKYDQLHRIKKSMSLASYTSGSGFATRTTSPAAYDENYTYDANGNIQTLQRYNETGMLTDDFNYQYNPLTNKLRYLKLLTNDLVINSGAVSPNNTMVYRNITLSGTAYVAAGSTVELVASNSITVSPNFHVDQGAIFNTRLANDNDGTYIYDAIGNLIKDNEKLVTISWTPYGKVREVKKMNTTEVTSFLYDGAGNRVSKKVVKPGSTTTTHYVRDAGGNVMAVYTNTVLAEQYVYGSSRLGSYKGGIAEAALTLGKRNYELSNHLGNVLAVITDNISMQGTNILAKVINTSDYYPFGLEMPGRIYTDATAYRYGFNGKEKDATADVGDTSYDYGFRIYNPRFARFLSVDPLTRSYPMLTPYQFAGNIPIKNIDLDGLEPAGNPTDWKLSDISFYSSSNNSSMFLATSTNGSYWVYAEELPNMGGHRYQFYDKGKWEVFRDDVVLNKGRQEAMYKLTEVIHSSVGASAMIIGAAPYLLEESGRKLASGFANDLLTQFVANYLYNGHDAKDAFDRLDYGKALLTSVSGMAKFDNRKAEILRKAATEFLKTSIDLTKDGLKVNYPGDKEGTELSYFAELITRQFVGQLPKGGQKEFEKILEDAGRKIFRQLLQDTIENTGRANSVENDRQDKTNK